MEQNIRPLIAGNWKMNGVQASLAEVAALKDFVGAGLEGADIALCLPATLISSAAELLLGSPVAAGAQDCHPEPSGAHTGDISAEMLADAGAKFVIAGHSERRTGHGEKDALVAAKAVAAARAGLTPIICVGETEAERRAGKAVEIVSSQLSGSIPKSAHPEALVIAYEPVWAIGTGVTPSLNDIAQMHGAIRALLLKRLGEKGRRTHILYGGSMKPDNAPEILRVSEVNGGLVGGASLKAKDLISIVRAA